ncbi:antibiotic biosynthesis monooxygenase [Tuanshanicoccus lijuaniae]|uniref:putative quinol monooxygenase n=1 Tax=Aerococcaceae bacterium zg-1292 TaxID=2774330 RepID=UPI001936E60C|nr:antibiotic biosynthesis monooxygenase [Aerococcaceae bacterium zg-1292]QQA36372.1 antibiotic biosynthesis monooxygenase [Aerococcaceae bacterium zg-1292]
MTIHINIYYTGNNGLARKFAEEMLETGIVETIRSKPGNLGYQYFSSLENPETILLVDAWDNQHALDLHHQSETMQQIIDLRDKYDLKMVVERFVRDGTNDSLDREYIRE